MKNEINVLINEYIENATIQGEATLDGDYKRGNKAVKKLTKIYKLMEQDDQLAIQILEVLFKDENINIRLCASAHAIGLKLNISQAIALLEEISANSNAGILGFDAEMSLKTYYKQGYLKFY